jgi:hypothetical protein
MFAPVPAHISKLGPRLTACSLRRRSLLLLAPPCPPRPVVVCITRCQYLSRSQQLPHTSCRRGYTFHCQGVQAFGTCKFVNSFVYKSLVPLCRHFALFSAFVSFVFNRLRPLFPKHPGVGGTHAPTSSLYPSDSVFPPRRCCVSPLLVPSYFAGLSRFCIPSPIVPVPPSQLHLLLLQEACL